MRRIRSFQHNPLKGLKYDRDTGLEVLAGSSLSFDSDGNITSTADPDDFCIVSTVSESEIVNTTTPTKILSTNLAANTLAAGKIIEVSLWGDYLNGSGSNQQLTPKVTLGTSAMWEDTSTNLSNSAHRRPWRFYATIQGTSSNNQLVSGSFIMTRHGSATTGTGILHTSHVTATLGGAATENHASVLNLSVSLEHSAANASLSAKFYGGFIRKIN
jgi:hypothetical protein